MKAMIYLTIALFLAFSSSAMAADTASKEPGGKFGKRPGVASSDGGDNNCSIHRDRFNHAHRSLIDLCKSAALPPEPASCASQAEACTKVFPKGSSFNLDAIVANPEKAASCSPVRKIAASSLENKIKELKKDKEKLNERIEKERKEKKSAEESARKDAQIERDSMRDTQKEVREAQKTLAEKMKDLGEKIAEAEKEKTDELAELGKSLAASIDSMSTAEVEFDNFETKQILGCEKHASDMMALEMKKCEIRLAQGFTCQVKKRGISGALGIRSILEAKKREYLADCYSTESYNRLIRGALKTKDAKLVSARQSKAQIESAMKEKERAMTEKKTALQTGGMGEVQAHQKHIAELSAQSRESANAASEAKERAQEEREEAENKVEKLSKAHDAIDKKITAMTNAQDKLNSAGLPSVGQIENADANAVYEIKSVFDTYQENLTKLLDEKCKDGNDFDFAKIKERLDLIEKANKKREREQLTSVPKRQDRRPTGDKFVSGDKKADTKAKTTGTR